MSNEPPASQFVEVKAILYALAKLLSQTQQAFDRRNLDLARQFLESETSGFSLDQNSLVPISYKAESGSDPRVLPLSRMVSFPRYRISELLVEFGVVRDDLGSGVSGAPTRFFLVPPELQTEQVRSACFKVCAKQQILAEFEIAGETKATLVLGGG